VWRIGWNAALAICLPDPVPPGIDVVLLSNVLHDWDVPECRALIERCAAVLPLGGRLLIHDVFLNDALERSAADRALLRRVVYIDRRACL